MIKYNKLENKYLYNPEDIDKIIEIIKNSKFYHPDNCTKEKITELVNNVKSFMSNMKIIKENVTLERHETEEEARAYFGEDFIKKFDELLTLLDKEETIVALHGTNPENCPKICEEGLIYTNPSLSSTAVQQSMNYGEKNMHYEKYENLLNWGHKNYKGLVIIAVPYECYYKEGLWNHFRKENLSAYGVGDYKIDSDFIAGYIDVINKKIIINPKYNRNHNYTGYVKDFELYKKIKDMDNDKFKKLTIEIESQFRNTKTKINEYYKKEEPVDISKLPDNIEELIGIFNSVKYGFPNGMTEERYKYLLEQLSYGFNNIEKSIPYLKTNEEVQKENEEKYSVFNNESSINNQDDDWDNYNWDDDIEWEPLEDTPNKTR